MENSFKLSVERAIKLLGTPKEYNSYVVLKLKPVVRSCCCFHCWPQAWVEVNRFIVPCGPLEDEGDVLIDKDNTRFVLQCHESGPEIVVYLGTVTAVILLVKSIIELITALLKSVEKERKKEINFSIIYFRQTKKGLEETEILRINSPLNEKSIKNLSQKIKAKIEDKKE